ncbi:MAG TPA: EAL domain-containing protein, partial [Gammaproteobacteria bacterium]|nr:EAL domain-containing protein [Gammaproteobacteria bacterium]
MLSSVTLFQTPLEHYDVILNKGQALRECLGILETMMSYGLLAGLALFGLGWALTLIWAIYINKRLKGSQITERKSQLLEKMYHRDPAPLLHLSQQARLIYANPASKPLCEAWKVKIGDLLKSPWGELTKEILATGRSKELDVDCGHQIFNLKFDALKEDNAVNIYGTDITQRKHVEKELSTKSLYDPLTQLPNRALFHDRINLEISRAKIQQNLICILIMQLDNFQEIRDSGGEKIADSFLIETAHRITEYFGKGASIARTGDRDFGIILTQVAKPSDALSAVQGIIEKSQQVMTINEKELRGNFSVGIAIFPGDGEDADTLIRNAHLALSRAGELHKNHEFYQRDMADQVEFKRQLLVDLHKAVTEKEFTLHFQPQVNLKLGKIMGAEALIRWLHPVKGYISPFFFVSLAEECGLIVEMGEWILDTVCAQIHEWQKSGVRPVQIGVNFSPVQFLKADVVSQVKTALEKYQIDPKWIECEITEGAMIHDIAGAIQTMQGLRALGVELSI